MKRVFITVLIGFYSSVVIAQECVILLHGMARSDSSMSKMALALTKADYAVVNYDYPSTDYNIASLAKTYLPKAIAQCNPQFKINFVTHSLGGIILRKYLSDNPLNLLGRVVMLGPPNNGSEVVDTLKNVPGFKLINGPAGMELGTDINSVPASLGAVTYPVGIIAGSSTINPILSQMLPNPDDGKVSVESTRVAGMADHIVLPVSHPFLMRDDEVIKQVKYFLQNGLFFRQELN